MRSRPVPDSGRVIPPYRWEGDPLAPVPVTVPCGACGGIAALSAYIVGYGYDCISCGWQVPIICHPR